MLLPVLVFGPMLCAAVSYLIGRRSKPGRDLFVVLTGAAAFALSLTALRGGQAFDWEGFCGLGLHLRADGFRSLYAAVASFMWMLTGLLSPEYFAHYHNRNRYYFFNLLTLGATLGVFCSDDLYTTLIFFEIMSLTSYTWVAHEETPGAMRASGTYLAVAVIGGLTTLMGLFLLWHELGTLSFDGLREAVRVHGRTPVITAASWLTLFGFAAKAGMFPLHIWLPKAHPVAPAPASALLSGILTKSGVFGLIVVCSRLMYGDAAFGRLLLCFAAVTMFLGALLALFSVDLKRTLACSSVSQIGFITVGLAMMVLLDGEGSLAAYGALEHMVNHSLFKLCLFMCAGVVYMNLHRLNLNEVRGFGRGKTVLHIAFLIGAVSIACIPPFGSGFNSKSLLHEGILEYIAELRHHGEPWGIYKALEILFLISGGMTIAYMTKLYVCLFHERNAARQAEYDAKNKTYIRKASAAALLMSAAVMPLFGLFGSAFMTPLAERSMPFFGQEVLTHGIHYFSWENIKGALESLAIGAFLYFVVVRKLLMRTNKDGVREYVDLWPAKLDLENLVYRPLLGFLTKVLSAIVGFIASVPECRLIKEWIPKGIAAVTAFIASVPDSRLIREWIPRCIAAVTAFIASLPYSRMIKERIPHGITSVGRFLSGFPEGIALLLKRTVLGFAHLRKEAPVGSRLTYALGRGMNRVARALNATVLRRRPVRDDFEYVLDAAGKALGDTADRVIHSVSFGLLLLVLGLLAMCIYLLLQ